jgi:hypothetical protein
MSRKFNRARQIDFKVRQVLESPEAIYYLTMQIIRPKPKLMPRFVWKLFLLVVMAPSTRYKTLTK